jgi:hypothetical protein
VELGDQIAAGERGQEESAEEVIKWRMADGCTVFLFQYRRDRGMSASRPKVSLLHGDIHLGLEPFFGGNVLPGGKAMIMNQESSVLEMVRLVRGLPGRGDGAVEDASYKAKSEE